MSQKLHKVLSIISGLSLVFNSILPSAVIPLLLNATPVYAQTETPTPTDSPNPTLTDTVTPTPTDTITIAPTPTETVSPTQEVTPTIALTPTVTPTGTEEATPSPTPETLSPTPTEVPAPTETSPPTNPTQEQGQILDGASTVAPTPTSTGIPTIDQTTHGHIEADILKNTKADTLDLDAGNLTTSATLTTDKADYAPTDSAVISGSGFLSNHTYNLTISSTDEPATSTTVSVITDTNGSFIYAYQLDGTYRPNYSVVVKDENGIVVATVTFTDDTGVPAGSITATYNASTGQLIASGNYSWSVCDSHNTSKYVGFALFINGGNPMVNDGKALDGTGMHVANSGSPCTSDPGSWSDSSHNASTNSILSSAPTSVCVVTYDVMKDHGNFIATGNHSITGAGSNRNGDNSYEQNGNSYGIQVENGEIDVNQDGNFDNADDGSLFGKTIINGLVDWNGSGSVTSADDSPANAFNGFTVINGQVDINNSGTISNSDDGFLSTTSSTTCVAPTVISANGTIELKKTWSGTAGQTTLQIGTTAGGTQTDSQLTGASGAAPLTTGQNSVNAGTYYVSETGGLTHYSSALACFNDTNNNGVNNNEPAVSVGANNSVIVGSGTHIICTFTNTYVPYCGDGVKNGAEQCDGSDLGGLSSSTFACSNQCALTLIDPKVTICHATDSQHNPYITNQPDKTADVGGHDGHTGPVWFAGITSSWGDIIPPFDYIGGSYPGKNWNTAGQAIWNNSCNADNGTIIVHKQVDTDGDGAFETADSGANTLGFRWTLDGSGANTMGSSLSTVPVGTHTVGENTVSSYHLVGWYPTGQQGWSCTNLPQNTEGTNFHTLPLTVNVGAGGTSDYTFCNARDTGTVVVHKDVVNPDGGAVDDTSETFTVNLDGNPKTLTDGETVTYTNVPTGTHTVTETTPSDEYEFVGITPDANNEESGAQITVTTGQTTHVYVTNKQKKAHITVVKHVVGPDGKTDVTDTNGTFVFGVSTQSATIKDDESHTFDVNPGSWDVTEQTNANYAFVSCSADYEGDTAFGTPVTQGENVTVGSNDSVTVTCINKQKVGKIIVTKYEDDNGNGAFDEGEKVLSDWDMHLTQGEDTTVDQTTDASGAATFADLLPNTYFLSETQKPGWALTNISCTTDISQDNEEVSNSLDSSNNHGIRLSPDAEVHCSVFNQPQTPILTITKSNNTGGADKHPGDSVLFTLTVTATQAAALDVHVTDLPAGGFVYRPGSWTANSSDTSRGVAGDLKAGGITTEPTYHSPGVWNLGDMSIGETVTLSYIADISGDEQPGLYNDLAWAKGENIIGDAVVATSQTDPSTTFVGTQVNVIADTQFSSSHNVIHTVQGQVLGASTELPATGANALWLFVAFALITGGLTLGTVGWFLRRKYA